MLFQALRVITALGIATPWEGPSGEFCDMPAVKESQRNRPKPYSGMTPARRVMGSRLVFTDEVPLAPILRPPFLLPVSANLLKTGGGAEGLLFPQCP
jgi:hypothetical protein